MSTDIALRLAAAVVLVAANAFFVASEFALTRIRQLPAEQFQETRNLRRAWKMTERLEIYLTGCQLGITTTSILLGVVAEPAFTALLEPLVGALGWTAATRHVVSVVIAVVIMNLIHKIWGEQAPTYLGVERPRMVAQHLAPGLYWWTKAMYPVIIAGDGLAKASLRLFGVEITRSWTTDEADEEGADGDGTIYGPFALRQQMLKLLGRVEGLPRERREEVMAALDIGHRTVRDILVPREEIVALNLTDSLDHVIRLVREHPLTRFPLIGDSLEDFRGIVYVPALLGRMDELEAGTCRLSDIAAPPLTLPDDTSIADAVDRLQEEHQELALVLADGRVVGLMTTTDAFEAIAGQLEDPFDEGAGEALR